MISKLSSKNQTTIGNEFVKALGLKPGTKLMQTMEGGRIVIQPIGDLMSAFGALKGKGKPNVKSGTPQEDNDAFENAVVKQVHY